MLICDILNSLNNITVQTGKLKFGFNFLNLFVANASLSSKFETAHNLPNFASVEVFNAVHVNE